MRVSFDRTRGFRYERIGTGKVRVLWAEHAPMMVAIDHPDELPVIGTIAHEVVNDAGPRLGPKWRWVARRLDGSPVCYSSTRTSAAELLRAVYVERRDRRRE